MSVLSQIPEDFWALFRSKNRLLYMEALLALNEEYQYNNYFLSWEICVQVLEGFFSDCRLTLAEEEPDADAPAEETKTPPAARTLSWLLRHGWLERQEDYARGITNVIIPDRSAAFLDAFVRLREEDADDVNVYIRNVYASLFSFMHDEREDLSLLQSALANTRILNKNIQGMLHNMNRFFASLLAQDSYGDLLKEHLDGYVEEVVQKKYRILKTSDNFYIYKNDIKDWLHRIDETASLRLLETEEGEDSPLVKRCRTECELVREISRGFDDIETRIRYLDLEHMKYVRATTVRLNYLINADSDTTGLLIRFLNGLSGRADREEALSAAAERMRLNGTELMSKDRFYRKRGRRRSFREELGPDSVTEELTAGEILELNRSHSKFSRSQIRSFLEAHMKEDTFAVGADTVQSEADFEKLILAYDLAVRRDGGYNVSAEEEECLSAEGYRYPKLTFTRKEDNR